MKALLEKTKLPLFVASSALLVLTACSDSEEKSATISLEKNSTTNAQVEFSQTEEGQAVLRAKAKAEEQAKKVLEEAKSNESASKQSDVNDCLLYTSPSPRDLSTSRMPSSA